MAKLTLNADPEVIEQAKRLASEANTSVSALFSRFVRVLAQGRETQPVLGHLTRKASGVIPLDSEKHTDILTDALLDEYDLS